MRFSRAAFDYRTLLAGLPLIAGLLLTLGEWRNAALAWILAGVLSLLGAGLRAWARCHNTYGGGVKKSLATTGPYALVRNPLYLGNTLLIGGAAAASRLLWMIPIALVWAVGVYSVAVRHEDRRLVSKYGEEYRRYRALVPAWLPRIPAPGALVSMVPAGAFLISLASQALQASALLVPFIIKDLNPLGIWSE